MDYFAISSWASQNWDDVVVEPMDRFTTLHRTLEDKSGGGARLTDIYVLFPAQLTSSPASPHRASDEVGYSNDLLCPQLIDDNG